MCVHCFVAFLYKTERSTKFAQQQGAKAFTKRQKSERHDGCKETHKVCRLTNHNDSQLQLQRETRGEEKKQVEGHNRERKEEREERERGREDLHQLPCCCNRNRSLRKAHHSPSGHK